MSHKIYLCIVIAILTCTACTRPTNTMKAYENRPENYSVDGTYRKSIESNITEVLTDESMTIFFQDFYGLKSLQEHKVYWNEQVLQIDYCFSQNVTASEIDTARSFVLNKFVMKIHNKNAISSYEHWMRSSGTIRSIPEVISNIMVDEQLIIQDNYQSGQIKEIFESSEFFIPARTTAIEGETELKDFLREIKTADIKVQKSIITSALFLSIEVAEIPPISKLEEIEDYIITTIAPQNSAYEKVVLSLSQNGKRFFSSSYHGGGNISQFGQKP